jgi:hypothetical protein
MSLSPRGTYAQHAAPGRVPTHIRAGQSHQSYGDMLSHRVHLSLFVRSVEPETDFDSDGCDSKIAPVAETGGGASIGSASPHW